LLDLAAEKDRGFDARVFVEMLTSIDRLPRAAFALDDVRFEGLRAAISAWNERALDYAREQERSRGVRNDRGPDLGLGR
jgi:hypothetical protein